MKHLFATIILLGAVALLRAQTGNVGIGNTAPASKLTVNGSFAASYNIISANAYTAGENDFYMNWAGTAAGTITLPASTSGPDRTGRVYFVKNSSSVYTLTIDGAGTELIDSVQTVVLQPGEATILEKTNINIASGRTYEIINLSQTNGDYVYAVSSSTSTTENQGSIYTADFSQIDFSTNSGNDFNLTTDTWTCPLSGTYRIEFLETGTHSTANASMHILQGIAKNNQSLPLPNNQQTFYEVANVPTATPPKYNTGYLTVILSLQKGDLINALSVPCNGCGVTTMTSTSRKLVISRL